MWLSRRFVTPFPASQHYHQTYYPVILECPKHSHLITVLDDHIFWRHPCGSPRRQQLSPWREALSYCNIAIEPTGRGGGNQFDGYSAYNEYGAVKIGKLGGQKAQNDSKYLK